MSARPLGFRGLLAQLVRTHRWSTGAELGLAAGRLSRLLLETCPTLTRLVGVDAGWDAERLEAVQGLAQAFPSRYVLHVMRTGDAAALVPDGSLDFVFIDADHSYEGVRIDIDRWLPKVRPGGWFGGHDHQPKYPGLIQAVRETFGDVDVLPHSVWQVWR